MVRIFIIQRKTLPVKNQPVRKRIFMKQEEFTIFNSISSLVHMEPAVMICHCDKDNGSICLSGHYDERTRVKTIKNLLFRPQFGPTRWTGADVESAEPNGRTMKDASFFFSKTFCKTFQLEDFVEVGLQFFVS